MGNDTGFLCEIANKINRLIKITEALQKKTGLDSDDSVKTTLEGRVKRLEEDLTIPGTQSTQNSRIKVDSNLLITGNQLTLTETPVSDIVNNIIIAKHPTESGVYEDVKVTNVSDRLVDLDSNFYNGWTAIATYQYESKTTMETKSILNGSEELVKDFYTYNGTVYQIKITITPISDSVLLKWVSNIDTDDYTEESIDTEHIRLIGNTEFNHTLYLTGDADIKIEVRNRIN